jgi:hypothetical protein
MFAAVAAIAIVGVTIAVLVSYSDAKYHGAVAAANGYEQAPLAQMALDAPRVEVVATRAARTRTANVSQAPRPQS